MRMSPGMKRGRLENDKSILRSRVSKDRKEGTDIDKMVELCTCRRERDGEKQ